MCDQTIDYAESMYYMYYYMCSKSDSIESAENRKR